MNVLLHCTSKNVPKETVLKLGTDIKKCKNMNNNNPQEKNNFKFQLKKWRNNVKRRT